MIRVSNRPRYVISPSVFRDSHAGLPGQIIWTKWFSSSVSEIPILRNVPYCRLEKKEPSPPTRGSSATTLFHTYLDKCASDGPVWSSKSQSPTDCRLWACLTLWHPQAVHLAPAPRRCPRLYHDERTHFSPLQVKFPKFSVLEPLSIKLFRESSRRRTLCLNADQLRYIQGLNIAFRTIVAMDMGPSCFGVSVPVSQYTGCCPRHLRYVAAG